MVGRAAGGFHHQRPDRARVGRRRRGAEEPREAGGRGRDPVGRDEVRLLQQAAAGRREVASRDRRAVGFEEDPARTVGAERLDRLRTIEDAARGRGADRAHAHRMLRSRVAEGVAGRRNRQRRARVQAQIAVRRAGVLDDDEAGAVVLVGARPADVLERILRAVLRAGRAGEDVVVRVDQEQVVVVGRPVDRIGPLQADEGAGGAPERVPGHAAAEVVVGGAGTHAAEVQRCPGREVALPDFGRAVAETAAVARCREVIAAPGCRRADRAGDDAVLEGRRQQIADIVHDDVGAGRAEALDVLRHLRRPAATVREEQLGARREIVDDLEHRRPLAAVAPAAAGQIERAARLPGQDGDVGGHVARLLLLGERLDAVGDHRDADAGAVHVVRAARHVRPVGGVTLTRIDLVTRRGRRRVESAGGGQGPPLRPGARLVRRPDPLHVGELGERLEAGQRQPGPDGPVARNAVDDGAACGIRRQQPVRRRRAVGAGRSLRQEVRADLALRRRARCLRFQQRRDLRCGPLRRCALRRRRPRTAGGLRRRRLGTGRRGGRAPVGNGFLRRDRRRRRAVVLQDGASSVRRPGGRLRSGSGCARGRNHHRAKQYQPWNMPHSGEPGPVHGVGKVRGRLPGAPWIACRQPRSVDAIRRYGRS